VENHWRSFRAPHRSTKLFQNIDTIKLLAAVLLVGNLVNSLIMMNLAALLAILAGSVTAFAPAQVGKASTALNGFEGELGSQASFALV